MIFDGWNSIFHSIIVGTLGYIALIILLRVSGKRTLSKWNAFDFIVTIAFGSILASLLLSRDTALLQGVIGFGLLVLLQYLISWFSVRSGEFQNLIKSEPALLLYRGEIRHTTLQQERVTEGELRTAIRANGIGSLEDVEAVVLETDGSFSVIENLRTPTASALADVKGYPRDVARI
jgi:uncharacterized membrane protein YcaP (DUF421 family)